MRNKLCKYYGPRLALKDPFHTGLPGFITVMGIPVLLSNRYTRAALKNPLACTSELILINNKNKQTMKSITLKWVLPIAFLTISAAFLAFKPASGSLSETTLYFKYQPASDFSSTSVTSNSNWQLVAAAETCEQEENDVACSFSIRVPEEEADNYLTSSNTPSARVTIQANGAGSNYHVDNVLDNATSSVIMDSKANVVRP